MAEYISREAANKALCEFCGICAEPGDLKECEIVSNYSFPHIPSANVVEKTEWDKLMFLVEAANQILEAAKWISVKERLPDENSTVIALARDDKMQKVTTCRFGQSHFVLTGRVAYWKVTHWMPLPKPPEEEKC